MCYRVPYQIIHHTSTLQFVINTVCFMLNDKLADDNYAQTLLTVEKCQAGVI